MGPNQITSIVSIKPDQKRALESVLKDIGNPVKDGNPYLTFPAQTQFARFVIIPGRDENDVIYPGEEPLGRDETDKNPPNHRLLFMACFTGDTAAFLNDFVKASKQAGQNIDGLWSLCDGYTSGTNLGEYLTRGSHIAPAQIFYATFPDETADSVRAKVTRRDAIENIVDRLRGNVNAAVTEIKALPALSLPPPYSAKQKAIGELIRAGIFVLIGIGAVLFLANWFGRDVFWITLLVMLALVAWIFVPVLVMALRPGIRLFGAVEDQADELGETRGDEKYQTSALTGREDVIAQNQFNLYLTIKGNFITRRIRTWRMVILMYILARLAQINLVSGSLAGLTTVHFGHWVLIDGGRRLFFMTSYDGSWENYVSDFVNKIYQLLDVQLMNFEGFAGDGTRNIAAFRRWLRRVQVQSDVFYSGYPHATVRNITHARKIIATTPTDTSSPEDVQRWLRLL